MSHMTETLQVERAPLPRPLSDDLLRRMHAYWSAANYLSVGQIYLLDNPLLREPLRVEHTKPRLLGHWGTTPGLNLVYAHLNRVIRNDDLVLFFACAPGPGGPPVVATTSLQGSYSRLFPNVPPSRSRLHTLFR